MHTQCVIEGRVCRSVMVSYFRHREQMALKGSRNLGSGDRKTRLEPNSAIY